MPKNITKNPYNPTTTIQSGGSTIREKLSSFVTLVLSLIEAIRKIVNDEITNYNNCPPAKSYPIAYYFIFYIYPLIIIITSIIYIFDVSSKLIQSQQANFYEDVLKFNEVAHTLPIQFANIYISQYTLTFFIMIILYVVTGLYLYWQHNKIQSDTCQYYKNKTSQNYVPALMFFAVILIIIIIDFSVYGKFYSAIGSQYTIFKDKINTYVVNYINKDNSYQNLIKMNSGTLTEIVHANTTEALKSYVDKQITSITTALPTMEKAKITDNDMEQIREREDYKNIVSAYITYGVIKTIEDNAYHTKKSKGSNFFTHDNIFLTINQDFTFNTYLILVGVSIKHLLSFLSFGSSVEEQKQK